MLGRFKEKGRAGCPTPVATSASNGLVLPHPPTASNSIMNFTLVMQIYFETHVSCGRVKLYGVNG